MCVYAITGNEGEREGENKTTEVLYEQPLVYSTAGPTTDSKGAIAGLNGHSRSQNGAISSRDEYTQMDLHLGGRGDVQSPQYYEVPGVSISRAAAGSVVYYEVEPTRTEESREPQEYALPVASSRATTSSQPYEVPIQSLSNSFSVQVLKLCEVVFADVILE